MYFAFYFFHFDLYVQIKKTGFPIFAVTLELHCNGKNLNPDLFLPIDQNEKNLNTIYINMILFYEVVLSNGPV